MEITTDLIHQNFDQFEQSYSEFSGVSISADDSENNYCKGINYSQLQLPQNHILKHLIIKYQMIKRPSKLSSKEKDAITVANNGNAQSTSY